MSRHLPLLAVLAIVATGSTARLVWAAEPTNGSESATSNVPAEGLPTSRGLSVQALWTDNGLTGGLFLLGALVLGVIAGRIASVLLRWLARRCEIAGRSVGRQMASGLIGPANLALIAMAFALGPVLLVMAQPLDAFWWKTTVLLLTLAVVWYLWSLASIVEILLRRAAGATDSSLGRQMGPLVRGTLRFAVVAVAVLFVVDSVFDQDVGALLAGLGIAGLAVSLAAQDSLKNLLGSITILIDHPFQVGDRIVHAGHDGTVEEIGFRSSKIRTGTGHVVTIPNAGIVSDTVENISRRPFIRRTLDLTLALDTPRPKVERAVRMLRDLLEDDDLAGPIHPTINGADYPPRVYFNDFARDGLNLRVLYWYAPPAYWDYLDHAQELNLRILEAMEEAGVELVPPSQVVRLRQPPNASADASTQDATGSESQ